MTKLYKIVIYINNLLHTSLNEKKSALENAKLANRNYGESLKRKRR